jgi:hypothetical protein
MSTLVTNKIIDIKGQTMLQKGGAVWQTKQFVYNTVYENSTQGSEYDLPSPLGDGTAQITPAFSSSRILFTGIMHCGNEQTWRQNFFTTYYKIGAGAWTQFNGSFAGLTYNAGTDGTMYTAKCEFLLSSLSTTSTVSFKVTQTGHANGGNLHLNQNNTTSSTAASNTINCYSSITLKEITQ